MKPSRRAFLFGRGSVPETPWQQFCQRLTRACLGQVSNHGTGTARLAPVDANDVQRARELCRQYGVKLALTDTTVPNAPGQQVLWLDPAPALTRLAPLPNAPGMWHAQAGVRLADLLAAGLTQFAGAPADMTLAAWLADPASKLCATGRTRDAGVVSLDVLLADGTHATLGAFGEHATAPLRGAAVQRLIPRLFELSRSVNAETCLAQPRWPARVRLDALRGDDVNLAHLLLGHADTLVWINSAVLTATPAPHDSPALPLAPHPAAVTQAAARLNAAVERLFDLEANV